MLYYIVAAKLMSTKEIHHMEDLKSSRTGLSAASMWIQTDGGCKLEGRKHFNKSNVWTVHKEDKKGKTEAGRWRGDRSRAETDGEKWPGRDFLSALSPSLPQDSSYPIFPPLHPPLPSLVPSLFFSPAGSLPASASQGGGAGERSGLTSLLFLLLNEGRHMFHWSQWAEDAQTSTQ